MDNQENKPFAAPASRVHFDDATIEAAALKHVATDYHNIAHLIPNYRYTEQFARLKAFAEELASGFCAGRNAQPDSSDLAPTTSTVSAPEEVRNEALDEGLEMAARHLDKQRQAVDQDHAYQEPDTGAWVFDRPETEEYSNTLVELADEIRALKRTTSGKGEAA